MQSLPNLARESVRRRREERRRIGMLTKKIVHFAQRQSTRLASYFANEDPVFAAALLPALVLAAAIFVRSPLTNYIFDEQEALLANPYVNGKSLHWWQAFQ